jgi:dCMP deaminase
VTILSEEICRRLAEAEQASERSNCVRRHVGTIIVKDDHVLSTGWNGVGSKWKSCAEAGCVRCIEGASTGAGYDLCICIHAEQHAIASAARMGHSLDGASMYLNLRPCLGCLMLIGAAGIEQVIYREHWEYEEGIEQLYKRFAAQFHVFAKY